MFNVLLIFFQQITTTFTEWRKQNNTNFKATRIGKSLCMTSSDIITIQSNTHA